MSEFGFKSITRDNWLEQDPTLRGFVKLTPSGKEQISSNDLLDEIFTPQFNEFVPLEVKALFEVARGAMCYGYFFYPLYTLACEQLFRVIETAVTFKCKSLAAPARVKSFVQKVDFLIANSIVPENEKLRWQGIHGLRNISSHPESQSIMAPGEAIGELYFTVTIINRLYIGI